MHCRQRFLELQSGQTRAEALCTVRTHFCGSCTRCCRSDAGLAAPRRMERCGRRSETRTGRAPTLQTSTTSCRIHPKVRHAQSFRLPFPHCSAPLRSQAWRVPSPSLRASRCDSSTASQRGGLYLCCFTIYDSQGKRRHVELQRVQGSLSHACELCCSPGLAARHGCPVMLPDCCAPEPASCSRLCA